MEGYKGELGFERTPRLDQLLSLHDPTTEAWSHESLRINQKSVKRRNK